MRIVVAGSGGFVGRWLVPELESRGHTVVRLVRRREAAESPGRPLWDPSSGDLDPELLEGVDAVVVLSIDDLRKPSAYEEFLRPILRQLHQIDGRAPVSVMTVGCDPNDRQLQAWLD